MNIFKTDIFGLKFEKRYQNYKDDKDWLSNEYGYLHEKIKEEFSEKDKIILLECINKLKEKKSFNNILEIGVYRSSLTGGKEASSTQFLLNKKPAETKYLGVDANAACVSNIVNHSQNIFGINCLSQDHDKVCKYMRQIGMNTIDLLIIDGWHSINQLYLDFKYTELLSEKGIVFFHDTNYHPGPKNLLECVDDNLFKIRKFYEGEEDWGVAYIERIM